jgi:uncharacterized protein (TIGR02145 family)
MHSTNSLLQGFIAAISSVLMFLLLVTCNKTTPTAPATGGSWTATDTTLTDPDGNVYKATSIGNQVWTVENLKTTQYNDGTAIPRVDDGTTWADLYTGVTGAYCFLNNQASNGTKYGLLYNWYAVNTDKLAPNGWHVPTKSDWETLMTFLISKGFNYDSTTTENKIAKSMAAKTNWITINYDGSAFPVGSIGNDLSANNASGFSALPGGCRSQNNIFWRQNSGLWWSATISNWGVAWLYELDSDSCALCSYIEDFGCGLSVRLVKN